MIVRILIEDKMVRYLLIVLAVVLVAAGVLAQSKAVKVRMELDPGNPRVSLTDVERRVSAIYPVAEISVADLDQKIRRGDVVLFDVRDHVEFDASHLDGAIHLDPSADVHNFLAEHGARLANRTVVFYCAVGVRSGQMLERLKDLLVGYRPIGAYNLRGGIFRWFAEHRRVVDANGVSDHIHSYDAAWGALLQRTLSQTQ